MPKLVLGLGNPGEPYRATRHNVGFRVVEELARRYGVHLGGLECGALVGSLAGMLTGTGDGLEIAEGPALLALPQTYMNRSGWAARCLAERHALEPADVLVVYDEVHLPLGRLRLRRSGSPAGHRGMESIVESLRTDEVPRLRVGVGTEDGPPPGADLVEYVLAPFTEDEREAVERIVERAADACQAWLTRGVEAAMNEYNR